MEKWEALRNLLKADVSHVVHYSHDKRFEHSVTERYLKYMDELDARDHRLKIDTALQHVNDVHKETLKVLDDQPKGFLYTGVPDFDQKTWDKMLKNLEGLS